MSSMPNAIRKLVFSHVDAWCVALIGASVPLFVHQAFDRRTFFLLLGITCVYWLGFAVNDYFDAPYDAQDPVKAERNFFVQYRLPLYRALVWFMIMALVLFSTIVQFGRRGVLLTLIGCFIMFAYSAPPLRLKSRPGFDLLIHTIFVETFPYLTVLFLLNVVWVELDYIFLAVAMLGSLTAQLEQQARDFEVDSATDRNFTTAVGLRTNLIILRVATAILIVGTSLGFAFGRIPVLYGPLALAALPPLLRRFRHRSYSPSAQRLVYIMASLAAVYFVSVILFTTLR